MQTACACSRHTHLHRLTYADATDLQHATASAAAAGLEHYVVRIPLDELLHRHLPLVVRAMQSFDPMSLRNDVASELPGGFCP